MLGLSIDSSLTFDDSSHFDLQISGAASVDCKQESYTYDGSSISLPDEGNSGDCLHDAMASAGIKLESISYDAGADTVTVKVEKIIGISITLSKTDPMVVQFYDLPEDYLGNALAYLQGNYVQKSGSLLRGIVVG